MKTYKDIFGCTASLVPVPEGYKLTIINPYGQIWWDTTYKTVSGAEFDLKTRWAGLWSIVSE